MTITPDAQPATTSADQTSADHTVICYARRDEAFVVDVAAGLRSRGVPVWIDQWNIAAGADWSREVEAALHGCRTVVIVLSPEGVASDEVRAEIRIALDAGKRVVPLLYRPCDNIPGRLRLTQHLDFTAFPQNRERLLDRLADALQPGARGQRVAPGDDADMSARHTLLADVRSEAANRLASLGSRIPLRLEVQPWQVARSWDDEVGVPARQRPAAPATHVVEVFDRATVGGSLLILGAPGSGKTTVLLELLQELAARAERDARAPVPVLVSLVSWDGKQSIGDWLVDALKVKHGVRSDHSARWRDERRLAPLLDGLDELPVPLQRACVDAINDFERAYRPPGVVVCCRRTEYEHFGVKLRLRGAVCVLDLEANQIRVFLDGAGAGDLWNAISADPGLSEMARSPLLLSFMSELAGEPGAQRWLDAAAVAERRQRLFDAYLAWRLPAPSSASPYPDEHTRRWLKQLATISRRRGLSELLIERMQPDWLDSAAERWAYRAGVLICTAAAVILLWLPLDYLFGLIPRGSVGVALEQSSLWRLPAREDAPPHFAMLLAIAAVVGSIIASRGRIVPIETLTWSWTRAATNMRGWGQLAVVVGLKYAIPLSVACAYIFALAPFDRADDAWRTAGTFAGRTASAVLAVCLAFVKPFGWLEQRWQPVMRPRLTAAAGAAGVWSLGTVWVNTWLFGLVSAIGLFIVVAFSAALTDRCRMMLLRWLVAGAVAGVAVAALSWPMLSPRPSLQFWLSVSMSGALTIAMIAALTTSLAIRLREWRAARDSRSVVAGDRAAWARPMLTGLAIGTSLGVAAVVAARGGSDQPLRAAMLLGYYVHNGFLLSQLVTLWILAIAAACVAGLLAFLGGLAGALSGATGADVERRLVPNQGIRQSARNVVVFAILGTLIVGVPYGVLNLALASAMAWTVPTAGDWLGLGMAAGLSVGLLAGFLPGAACLQHFVLRFVLWSSGALPLRCVRFMNFATERRLVQRVGGRYAFIHVLLRDHLADADAAWRAAAYRLP